MKPKSILIKEKQTLSDLPEIYPLPTNAIFHKRVPGIGATHSEINAPRHSIIVLPNVPVIKSKVKAHNDKHTKDKEIFGVYKGIKVEQLVNYLNDDTVTFKKILITPESYDGKFKQAAGEQFGQIKQTYYLLIDECERAIQDVDFREKITAPFDDLFDFTNKGLVSATTLPFSEPRLADFTHYIIQPEYSYCKPLTLMVTNNIVNATRQYFIDKSSDRYFIFCSSISLITALIDALGIKAEAKIHCSEERARDLRYEKYHSSADFDASELRKFNFFTSRFYSAIDMKLGYEADILMLTDVIFADHSILDPQTEVIQIVGRLRDGVNSITHLSNVNPQMEIKDEQEIRAYLGGLQDVYLELLKLKRTMTGSGHQAALDEILTKTSFSKYFYSDGSFNWFMVDNYIQEQRVLGLYKTFPSILAAYDNVKDHFKVTYTEAISPLSDDDKLVRESAENKITRVKEVIEQYKRLKPAILTYEFYMDDMSALQKISATTVEAMDLLGEERIIELGYSEAKLKTAVNNEKQRLKRISKEVIADIYASFDEHTSLPESDVVDALKRIYHKHGIKGKAGAAKIGLYFEAHRSEDKDGDTKVKVQRLGNRKY